MRLSQLLLLASSALLLFGCGLFQQLDVQSLGTATRKPSNVGVYLSVADGVEPVTELGPEAFRIYENEQLLDPDETRQTLLEREIAALHHALLLVDMSTAKDDEARRQLSRGVAGFVQKVCRSQGVSVYAFDGRAGIEHIGDFARGASVPDELAALTGFKTADPSRNLHGAVIAGLKELGARLMTKPKPVRVGTLVVFTAGADRAGRATAEQMQQAVDGSGHQAFAIGVGAQGSYELGPLGKNGAAWTPSLGAIGPVLEEAAESVDRLYERHYLLSYCSPGRAGTRRVRVEVVHETHDGKQLKGDLTFEIDATGFDAGCDPTAAPAFVSAGSATPAAPPATSEPTAPTSEEP